MAVARLSRRTVTLLVGAAFLLAPLGEVATAHQFVDSSPVSIQKNHKNPYDQGETVIFRGKIKSPRKFCRFLRKVSLFKKRPGPDKFIEFDRTGARGRYKVTWPANKLGTHRFYVKVKPKVGGVHPHRHVCKGTRSRTVKVRVKQLPD
jgi:hypothetical protein